MVSIANHMQKTDATPTSIKPIVNCDTAVSIDNQTDIFINDDNVSSGLKSSHSSTSSFSGKFLLNLKLDIYLLVENNLSFKFTMTNVCNDNSSDPTEMKPEKR